MGDILPGDNRPGTPPPAAAAAPPIPSFSAVLIVGASSVAHVACAPIALASENADTDGAGDIWPTLEVDAVVAGEGRGEIDATILSDISAPPWPPPLPLCPAAPPAAAVAKLLPEPPSELKKDEPNDQVEVDDDHEGELCWCCVAAAERKAFAVSLPFSFGKEWGRSASSPASGRDTEWKSPGAMGGRGDVDDDVVSFSVPVRRPRPLDGDDIAMDHPLARAAGEAMLAAGLSPDLPPAGDAAAAATPSPTESMLKLRRKRRTGARKKEDGDALTPAAAAAADPADSLPLLPFTLPAGTRPLGDPLLWRPSLLALRIPLGVLSPVAAAAVAVAGLLLSTTTADR